MGSFGFDHRLTFPIHRAIYVPLPPFELYLALADLLALARPRFNLYSIESLLTGLSTHPLT